MRVDRLLGEYGFLPDTTVGRQEFERQLEKQRLEELDAESLKPLRRGWCLGSEAFRQRLLERIEGKLGDHHSGELRQESAQSRADRIMGEELQRLSWTPQDVALRRKSDPDKLAIAARLRRETTLSLKEVAHQVGLGTSKGANATLHRWMQLNGRVERPTPERRLKPEKGKHQ
jgi:hypothetical protein